MVRRILPHRLPLAVLASTMAAAAVAGPAGSAAAAGAGAAGAPTTTLGDVPACASHMSVKVAFGRGSHGAGGSLGAVLVTNRGDAACRLTGFPGVSFRDRDGDQIGRAATRAQRHPTVTIAPGRTAGAPLHVVDGAVYTRARCKPRTGARAGIILPGTTRVLLRRWSGGVVCAGHTARQLTVDAFRPVDRLAEGTY